MNRASAILGIVGIILLLIAGTAKADMIADSTHPVQFIFTNYNLNYTSNLSNSTETTTTTYLNLSINSSYAWFNMTVPSDLNLSQLTYASDIWNFTGAATAGTMRVTARVSNATGNYDLKVDSAVASTQSASGGIVSFTYAGWSSHAFTIQENTTSETPGAPSITSYSPADLTPTIDVNNLATFNAGSNQTVQWTWTGVTEGAGDGTTNSTATQTWATTGAKTVTVTCSNANGSCGTIQWDVTVVETSIPLDVVNTLSISEITSGSVTLNGNTTNVTGAATVWFEYGGNPSAYLYRTSNQSISGNVSFSSKITGMSLISGKTYYYKASGSYNSIIYSGAQKSFTMLTLDPTNYNFDKNFDNLTNSSLDVVNMTAVGASSYTDIFGAIFWGIIYSLIFIMIWMRQEDITLPSLLGLIIGARLWSSMPSDWTSMAMSLTVVSFAGLMFSIIKGRQ